MNNRFGLTLAELMVSLAISALLLATVMGMTARLSKAAADIRERHPVESWKEILKEKLQSDYSSARSIVVQRDRIVIYGVSRLNQQTSEGNYWLPVPAIVSYSIDTIEDRSLLTRSVRPLVRIPNQLPQTDFMADGIIAFRTVTPLPTDVAPGVVNLQLFESLDEPPIQISLVRHGMPE